MTNFPAPDARPVGEVIYALGLMLTLCVAPMSVSFAQVQSVTVSKGFGYIQTSATSVALDPASNNYSFNADVDGQNISSISAPIISGPINVAGLGTIHNNGRLVYSAGDSGWRWGFPNANDFGTASLSGLNSFFGSGTYTFTVNGASIPLRLQGDAYPNAPLLTLSGGVWSNGKYVIDPSQPLTITTNAFTAYGSHPDDLIGIAIVGGGFVKPFNEVAPFGCGWCVARQFHSAVPGTNVLSYTVPAFSFASGQDYLIFAGFQALVDVNPNPALPGSQNVAYYGVHTLLTVSAANIAPSTPLPPPPTTQSVFTAPTGTMPTAAVSVSPSGTFGNATLVVTLDLSKVLSGDSFAGQSKFVAGYNSEFAAGYNIYVAALVPSGALGLPSASWFVLPATHTWAALSSPIAAYLEGLAQDATNSVVISIMQDLDITGLVGTEFYIGYGTSDTEMLQAQRYRGFYILN